VKWQIWWHLLNVRVWRQAWWQFNLLALSLKGKHIQFWGLSKGNQTWILPLEIAVHN
jgi:hypothetical protein